MDDEGLLAKNKLVLAPDGPYQIWCTTTPIDYWPVTNTALWIEWRRWDQNPAGDHFTNLILHIAEVLLVWTVLCKLSIPGALLAAVIFAVHPVNVESVAWIAQRKNMMAMLFFLFVDPGGIVNTSDILIHPSSFILHPFLFWHRLSLAAFLLAMLSKGSVAVFPVLLLGIIWWLRSGDCPDFSARAPTEGWSAPGQAWSRWSAEMGLSPYSSDPARKNRTVAFSSAKSGRNRPFFPYCCGAGCGERYGSGLMVLKRCFAPPVSQMLAGRRRRGMVLSVQGFFTGQFVFYLCTMGRQARQFYMVAAVVGSNCRHNCALAL